MEFVIIAASITMREEIELFFKRNGINGYTLFPLISGSGEGGGTRLGTDIWPGDNLAYMVALSTDKYKALREWVEEYRKTEIREGLKLFTLAMKEMI